MKKTRVLIWNEGVHEREHEAVRSVYPDGIDGAIAEGLRKHKDLEVRTARLHDPVQGLEDQVLDETDVLIWWAHMAHDDVRDDTVDRVHRQVLDGMGLIALHSAHFSKIFQKLMGTRCTLRWREDGKRERLWNLAPSHPITQGIGEYFEIPQTEMYGERFDIPEPDELIFVSWFEGGEVFRSGCTWKRGSGQIFYFRPGHETHPIYYQPEVIRILANAARWAGCAGRWPQTCEMTDPVHKAS